MMAMYKNSMMSLIYVYLSLFMMFTKFQTNSNMKTILFVAICMLIQYSTYLFNYFHNYPWPFHEENMNPPYFNWIKYVDKTNTVDWL